jgi:hypothetical protein
MSLVGFTLLGTIEVPSITGSATAVPLLVKPNTEFTTTMLAALDAGGGDLRFGTEDGTTQYPCQIVDGLNTVWMTPTGLSVASAATVGVWGDNTGASQPAVGAAFGRNAVWVDFRYISHDGVTDSTGNSTITQFGSPTAGTNQFGGASVVLNGTTQYGRASSARTPTGAGYYSSWFKDTTVGATEAWGSVGSYNSTLAFDWESTGVSDSLNARGLIRRAGNGTDTVDSSTTYSVSTWNESTLNLIGIAEKSEYLNGAGKVTDTTSRALSGATYDLVSYGRFDDSSPSGYFEGELAEMWVSDTSRTDDFISIKYDNQSTAAATSWWIAADAGGGIVIAPTSIPSGESFGTPTIATGVVIISPVAIPTQESVGNPTILKELFISPVTILSEESVGDPVIELILKQIFPNGIPTEEFVGRPIVLGGDSIVIPVLSRQTWNAVAKYLRDLVFKGHDNDVIVAWLRSEGFEDGAYNDLWYDYLLQKGFIDGSLTDKYAAWRQDIAGDDPWILSSGSWNDNKIWRDNENWKDS